MVHSLLKTPGLFGHGHLLPRDREPQGLAGRADRLFLLACGLACVGLLGCAQGKEGGKDSKIQIQSDMLPKISVPQKGLLYSFFDTQAEFRTVDELPLIAKTALAEVMILDPRSRLPGDFIWVADLRAPSKDYGEYKVWLEPKSSWLDRVMPKKSLLAEREKPAKKKPIRKRPRPPQTAKAAPAQDSKTKWDVIMFSTTWCPSCKKAREFFQSKRVRMLDLDIEKDPQAASDYEQVVKQAGLKAQAVPVIIVRGKVFQGFSAPQMEAALASPSPA
jgi:glutaredoxin 3